jgi:rare lipoprotein A
MTRGRGLLCVVLLVGVSACAAPARTAPPPPTADEAPKPDVPPVPPTMVGQASWYGRFHHGKRTASGEIFDMHALTAAHRTLPLGTRVRVTNLSNGKSVVVRVNDRGPRRAGRIIDVSRGAAAALDAVADGVFPVEVVVLD